MTQSLEDLNTSDVSVENDIQTQQEILMELDEAAITVLTSRNPKLRDADNVVRQFLRDNVEGFCELDDLRINVIPFICVECS